MTENEQHTAVSISSHEIGDEKTYTTDWLTDKTINFIRQPRSKPFFFMLSIPDPHSPFVVRPPYDTMFSPSDMPIPSTFSQKTLPRWAASMRQRGLYPMNNSQREAILRWNMAAYYGMVKCIDDNVGRILNCLAEQGILNDTIVVFTSDHGDYLGEHGLDQKNYLYETVYRIPMLIRWPKKIQRETVIENIISTVDFQPTILKLIGIEPCGREQGRDASAILYGKSENWEDVVFIHSCFVKGTGIITPQYELAYIKNNDHILFDRNNDPDQTNNLFNDPNYKKIIDNLTLQIIKHNKKVNSPAASWL
jgi:arylsulfatase A-like enzyme